jgi:hypothetical protein
MWNIVYGKGRQQIFTVLQLYMRAAIRFVLFVSLSATTYALRIFNKLASRLIKYAES